MPILNYWPEMGQAKPTATAELRGSYSGKNRVWTPATLPAGRGVKLKGVLKADDLVPQAQHKAGWNEYEITDLALKTLSASITFSREALLD